MLNTPAGLVDLRTGKIRRHNHLDYCSKITAVAPGGKCPKWLKFLGEIMSGDQEMVDFLQRTLGYSITGHVGEHDIFFCWGTGRNGKSTLLNTVARVTGDYAAVGSQLDMFLETHRRKAQD